MRYVVEGTPVAKARPRRAAAGNWYTPRTTVAYEESIAWAITEKKLHYGDVPLSMRAEFHMPNHKAIDGDNLMKALLDGCEKGGLFPDDKQVVDFSVRVYFGSDNPRTEWEVAVLDDLPHSIYCSGHRSSIRKTADGWICESCMKPVEWLVL
jgi:Holliday junction resolvase RusA-like endonuclease